MKNRYHKQYFQSPIFEYDYAPIAQAILQEYNPQRVIEFGCGSGQLSKALATLGVTVTALDGYANPDFTAFKAVQFHRVDLNNPAAVEQFLKELNGHYDLAVCMEVAEHLQPSVSERLVKWMTAVADAVVFSAAVPAQDGDGHINCRTRVFWHQLFEQESFHLRDTIRKHLRNNPKVGKWYVLNTVDYQKRKEAFAPEEYRQLITNLVASESEAASSFYLASRRADYKSQLLRFPLVGAAFALRNFLKTLVGQKPLPKEMPL